MKYLNPYVIYSQYSGPFLYNEKEKEDDSKDEDTENEDNEDKEEEKEEDENEDPLTTKNPYDEESKEHKAFEKQREKFKVQLAAAKKGGDDSRVQALEEKMDKVLDAVKPKEKEEEFDEDTIATDADVALVTDALKKKGFNVDNFLKTQRLDKLNKAIDTLKEQYPDIKVDAAELVKYANDTGISAAGGSTGGIIELAFFRKYKDEIRKGSKKDDKEEEKKDKKKGLDISNNPSKTDLSKPKKLKTLANWRKKMREKYPEE